MHSAPRGAAGLAPVADRGWVSDAQPSAGMSTAGAGAPFGRRLNPRRAGVGAAGPGPGVPALRPAPDPSPPGSRPPAGRNRVRAARPCRCRREGARAARQRWGCSRLWKRCRPNLPRELRAGPAWLKNPYSQYRNEVAAAQDPALPHAKSTRTRTVASSKNPHERHRPQCERRSASRTRHGAAGLRPAGVRGAGEDLVSVRRHVRQAADRGAPAPVAAAREVRRDHGGCHGAREIAAHQRRHHRPAAAGRETQAAGGRSLPHQAHHPPAAFPDAPP